MSEYDPEQQIPRCLRRNVDIKGYNIVDPGSLPSNSLTQCQELCRMILGCQYFSWSKDPNKPCFLKLKEAVESWHEESTSLHVNIYSGPANCGKTYYSFKVT